MSDDRVEIMSRSSAPPPEGWLRGDDAVGALRIEGCGDPANYLNREVTWLEFNRRVLQEAIDERTPLLERVNFLSIFTSNLDEFFMKRVGGLKRQVAAGVTSRSIDGKTAKEQLQAIGEVVAPMLDQQADAFRNSIRPALREAGVHLLAWDDLTKGEKDEARRLFRANIFPVLTPLAVDLGHPFPFISNLSQSLGVVLRQPDGDERLFARVKVPQVLPHWIQLTADPAPGIYRFIHIADIMQNCLDQLFPEMIIEGVMPFRITRNADIERDEEDAEDLLEMIEEELRQRRFANVVRLEHGPNPDPWVLRVLIEELELHEHDVYELPGELDYTDLRVLQKLPLAQHKYEPWTPIVPAPLVDEDADMFGIVRNNDLLVHHPYESFNATVERFIRMAADDPRVLAIKMTLYRTGDDSPFINLLVRAAEAGKQVVCLVELKARFDEQRNIQCAQRLENAGVHVVYGIRNLKTHTKIALVVRNEPEGMRSYAHIATGNYHVDTARLYTDLGLFTAQPELAEDVVELFHYLTGRSMKRDYQRLLVAPVNMRTRFLRMIEREMQHHRAGRPSHIVAKMNSLEDCRIIDALYTASQTGVPIDLMVRGFCCLRPGVPGVSENIRVTSIIGRFLEHSRVFYFRNAADDPAGGEFYLGSADWMYRNLENRVEAITPVDDSALRARLWQSMRMMLDDHRQAWDMQSDGSYVQRRPQSPAREVGTHEALMALSLHRQRLATIASPSIMLSPDELQALEGDIHASV